MLVFRVECPACSFGPYTCTCEAWEEEGQHLRNKHATDSFLREHPGMLVDFNGNRAWMDQYRCGFESMPKLLAWFDHEDLKLFDSFGFKLAVYCAEKVVESYSKAQVFFKPQLPRVSEGALLNG